ncbi:hypothetical protein [Psychrosphaera algicola]|uniref:Uncharacterized protein n=1 Tax=Psychrosphaera algicola TaxID=3023714 RepID=A0ABT5FBA4_9GAMM|nr:hypothetical protein [Psychrosphaera sp. G1-22]MDC2888828.1 hypothetical protein [Psychrosphaera sp. G1-22]
MKILKTLTPLLLCFLFSKNALAADSPYELAVCGANPTPETTGSVEPPSTGWIVQSGTSWCFVQGSIVITCWKE